MPKYELGASATKKYDIEAWMPGRGAWGEISSASNCTDYQARRLHIRCKPRETPNRSTYAHTVNGTAVAVPRMIVTLLENGARFDKDRKIVGVDLPKALQPYWIHNSARDFVRWV
jgi:seryl-tRNA synthetase